MMPAMRANGYATGIQFQITDNYEAMSQAAGAYLMSEIERKPEMLFCASAGSTPARMYELLAARRAQSPSVFSQLRVIKIDEWGGLPMADPGSCETGLQTQLVRPLGISADRYQGFNSQPSDFAAECARVAQWLAANGPIDICLLGLGLNGHIAMNEPAPAMRPRAHQSQLAPGSLHHPMLRDSTHKPVCGLTLGMADILQARRVLLLANGAHKQTPLKHLLESRISPEFPASFLWLHPDVTVLCDRAALPEGFEIPAA